MNELHGLGYWIDFEDPDDNEIDLPDPRILLDAIGPCRPDPRILNYLRSGRELAAWMGYSYCRFQCGVPDEQMGCRDLTDGIWVWPEGLVHYVEVHQVPLPEAFIRTMKQNQWHAPEAVKSDELFETGYSLETWNKWYQQKTTG